MLDMQLIFPFSECWSSVLVTILSTLAETRNYSPSPHGETNILTCSGEPTREMPNIVALCAVLEAILVLRLGLGPGSFPLSRLSGSTYWPDNAIHSFSPLVTESSWNFLTLLSTFRFSLVYYPFCP